MVKIWARKGEFCVFWRWFSAGEHWLWLEGTKGQVFGRKRKLKLSWVLERQLSWLRDGEILCVDGLWWF